MKIGKIVVNKNNEKVFEKEINNTSLSNGRLVASLEGSFILDFPLEKQKLYEINLYLDGEENINLSGVFEDYLFNAGGSDYYDMRGVHHSGIVTLNNSVQFLIV